MESNVLEAVWLNETGNCAMVHVAEVSGLDSAELQSLVDSGVLAMRLISRIEMLKQGSL